MPPLGPPTPRSLFVGDGSADCVALVFPQCGIKMAKTMFENTDPQAPPDSKE